MVFSAEQEKGIDNARISDIAAALYDGGWRTEDHYELIEYYDLSQDDANEICKNLKSMRKKLKVNSMNREVLF